MINMIEKNKYFLEDLDAMIPFQIDPNVIQLTL